MTGRHGKRKGIGPSSYRWGTDPSDGLGKMGVPGHGIGPCPEVGPLPGRERQFGRTTRTGAGDDGGGWVGKGDVVGLAKRPRRRRVSQTSGPTAWTLRERVGVAVPVVVTSCSF